MIEITIKERKYLGYPCEVFQQCNHDSCKCIKGIAIKCNGKIIKTTYTIDDYEFTLIESEEYIENFDKVLINTNVKEYDVEYFRKMLSKGDGILSVLDRFSTLCKCINVKFEYYIINSHRRG